MNLSLDPLQLLENVCVYLVEGRCTDSAHSRLAMFLFETELIYMHTMAMHIIVFITEPLGHSEMFFLRTVYLDSKYNW